MQIVSYCVQCLLSGVQSVSSCVQCVISGVARRVYYLVSSVDYLVCRMSSVDYLVCSVQNAAGCVQCSCSAEEASWLWRENTACGKSLPASQRPTLTSELHSTRWLSTAHRTLHTLDTAHTPNTAHNAHMAHTARCTHCSANTLHCLLHILLDI